MNKFNVLIACLMVFASVAQLCSAEDLKNEISDEQEVDDELEGGLFQSIAQKPVGVNSNDEWGWDVLDKNKGIKNLVGKRTPECKSATSEKACQTCCSGLDKSARYSMLNRLTKQGGCTCFSRDNNYAAVLA